MKPKQGNANPKQGTTVARRSFLQGSTGVFGAAALSGPLAFLQTKIAAAQANGVCGTRGESPYGPLEPAKDMATGLELIMLPRGFSYTTMSWRGDTMDDGNTVPSGHDGMAVVDTVSPGNSGRGRGRGPNGRANEIVLIRNHENFFSGQAEFNENADNVIADEYNYDDNNAGGGTTVLRWKNGNLLEDRVSISGTIANCAGGPSPWGSWFTCEEEIAGPGITSRFYNGEAAKDHGYVFESTVARVTNPTPLRQMGRMKHEAVAFDPNSGDVYLTEDNSGRDDTGQDRDRGLSGFYKFVPNNPLGGEGSLGAGGKLFMLKAVGASDLRDPECFSEYDVEWVEISNPDSPPPSGDANLASGPFVQGRDGGATRFQRLEGCWWHPVDEVVIFNDTEAGPIGAQAGRDDRAEGAVWAFDPKSQKLMNLFVAENSFAADNPDNVTVSPRGGILLCEDGGKDDGDGLSLLGLLENGQTFEFARNIIDIKPEDAEALVAAGHDPDAIGFADYSGQEWAGATFDPSGRWLFVNIQTPGITFAITGPWRRGIF